MLKRRTTVQDDLLTRQQQPDAPRPRRRRRLVNPSLVVRVCGLLFSFSLLVYFGLPLLLRVSRFRPVVEATVRDLLGRPAQIRELRYSPAAHGLVATDLSVDEDPAFGRYPVLRAKSAVFHVDLMALIFSSNPEVSGITLDDARLSLKQDRTGAWNFYGMLKALDRAPAAGHLSRLRLIHSVISVSGARGLKPLVLRDLTLDVPRFSREQASSLTVSARIDGGGTVTLNGTAGPVRWNGAVPGVPASLLIVLHRLNLEDSSLADAAPGLAGILSFDGSAESDGSMVAVSGQFKAEKIRLARNASPPRDSFQGTFTLRHDSTAHTGVLERCDLLVSKGHAAIAGSYAILPAEPLQLHLQVNATAASVTDLASLMPAAGYPLPAGGTLQGGLMFADLKLDGPVDRPVAAGAVSVSNTRVTRFDLAEKLAPVDALKVHDPGSDVDLTSWSAGIRIGPEGATLSNVRASISDLGEIAGSGAVANDCALDFRMTGTRPGGSPVAFTIRGTCAEPVFRPVEP